MDIQRPPTRLNLLSLRCRCASLRPSETGVLVRCFRFAINNLLQKKDRSLSAFQSSASHMIPPKSAVEPKLALVV